MPITFNSSPHPNSLQEHTAHFPQQKSLPFLLWNTQKGKASKVEWVRHRKVIPLIHFLRNGEETQESWKPLLNTIPAPRGSLEWFAQWNLRDYFSMSHPHNLPSMPFVPLPHKKTPQDSPSPAVYSFTYLLFFYHMTSYFMSRFHLSEDRCFLSAFFCRMRTACRERTALKIFGSDRLFSRKL